MREDRIDFSSLDPTVDQVRFEEAVASIIRAAEPKLAARRDRASVFGQVVGLWRPLLAAAAVAGIVFAAVLSNLGDTSSVSNDFGVAEALGVPESVAAWVRSDELPSTTELLVTLEER